MTAEERSLRDMLLDAVPPLPEPPDRIEAVAARARRTRATSMIGAAAAAVAVTLAIGVPAMLSGPGNAPALVNLPPPPRLLADGCPADRILSMTPEANPEPGPGQDGYSNRMGQLVPAQHVVSVSVCEQDLVPVGAAGARHPIRTLTKGAADMVALLNALPVKVVPAPTYATPSGQPPVIVGGMGCFTIGYPWESLVIRYAGDPAPVAVLSVDRNCGFISYDGADRAYDENVFATFFRLYRAELTARQAPADIPAPTCAPKLTERRLYPQTRADGPRDGIAATRGHGEAFLPSPLAVAVACRYTGTGGDLSLVAHNAVRENLAGVRDVLNEPNLNEGSSCGPRKFETPAPVTEAYSILVADVTAGVSEVDVIREPCLSLRSAVPKPELVDWLDSVL